MENKQIKSKNTHGFLTGYLLLAMPSMHDPRFEQSLIYICGHDTKGAMGIIINKHMGALTLRTLLTHIHLPIETVKKDLPIHFGGPVDTARGFVLHTNDFLHPDSVTLKNNLSLTSTVDMLRNIAEGNGPKRSIVAMGYAGWGPGQLDEEMQNNDWIHLPANDSLLFETPTNRKWMLALETLGINPATLSESAGQA